MKTITDASKIVDLTRRMIQEYEKAGIAIKPTEKNKYGYLIYDDAAINRLWQIKFYKELGYEPKDIKEILNKPEYDHESAMDDIIAFLEERKRKIEDYICIARTMKETGITPQSLHQRGILPDITYKDFIGLFRGISRQIDALEQEGIVLENVMTDEQFDYMIERLENMVTLFNAQVSCDDPAMQDALREFHVAASPLVSDTAIGLLMFSYLVTPGSEGARLLEEECELPGVAEYLQGAVLKYYKDHSEDGNDKELCDILEEIVSLGKEKYKPGSMEVQTAVKKLYDWYEKIYFGGAFSPIESMRSCVGFYRDPDIGQMFDSSIRARGAGRYVAAAIEYFCKHNE